MANLRVHAALLLSQLILVVHPVMVKLALSNGLTDPIAFAAIRSSIAVGAKMAVAHALYGVVPSRAHMRHLALTGLSGSAAYPLFFVLGMRYTTPTSACIIEAATPVFTAVLAAWAGVERLTGQRLAGVLMASAGAMGMLGLFSSPSEPDSAGGDSEMLGNFFILLSALSYAAFIVYQKPVVNVLPAITVTAWSSLFGGAAIVGVSAAKAAAVGDVTFDWDAALPGVLYAALITTTLGYFLEGWANKHSTATLVSAYCTLQPVGAAALSWYVLGETLSRAELMFAALVFAGVWVVSLAPPAAAVGGGGGGGGGAMDKV